MAGLGDEREGVGAEAEDEGSGDVGGREGHRQLEDEPQTAIVFARAGRHMHGFSLFLSCA